MILQITLLGSGILADGAKKLTWVEVELYMLFEVAAIGSLVLAVGAAQWFGSVVHLPGMTRHLVLIGRQVITAVTFERSFTCAKRHCGLQSS